MDRLSMMEQDVLKVVAHDLRNPLTCIESYVELLKEGRIAPADREKVFNRMLSCCRWANHIVNDLTDAEAAEEGKLHLERKLVALEEVVLSAVEDFRVLCQPKRVRLEARIEARSRHAMADADRLRQVLNNLLGNSLKNVAEEGAIRVILAETGTQLVVTVEDDGRGIDPNHQSRVFEKFYQAGADGRGSLGLGLFISRSIVELHGGRIWIVSDGLGKGASVNFTVPKYAPDAAYEGYRSFRGEATPPPRRKAIAAKLPDKQR